MAKHKKEIEVEFPDCDVCGRDIGDEEYLKLEITVLKNRDTSKESLCSYRDDFNLVICERCNPHPEIWKQKLLEVVDERVNRKQRIGLPSFQLSPTSNETVLFHNTVSDCICMMAPLSTYHVTTQGYHV